MSFSSRSSIPKIFCTFIANHNLKGCVKIYEKLLSHRRVLLCKVKVRLSVHLNVPSGCGFDQKSFVKYRKDFLLYLEADLVWIFKQALSCWIYCRVYWGTLWITRFWWVYYFCMGFATKEIQTRVDNAWLFEEMSYLAQWTVCPNNRGKTFISIWMNKLSCNHSHRYLFTCW